MIQTTNEIRTLANQYNIPKSELISLLINFEGVKHNSDYNRIRFELCNTGLSPLMFSVQNNKNSRFTINNNQLVFGNALRRR
ncbi:hypothetical protein ES705_32858 [subsurface metagenome]